MKNISPLTATHFAIKICFIFVFIAAVSTEATAAPYAGPANNIASGDLRNSFPIRLPFVDSDPCYGESEDQANFFEKFHIFPVAAEKRWGARFVDGGEKCDEGADSKGGEKGADGVDAMDFDGDCDLDVITGWEESGRVFVYLNPLFTKRPVPAGSACPERWLPENTKLRDSHPITSQWPFTEVTRQDQDAGEQKPFEGVEDAVFGDHDGDGVADYVVIATERGREKVFVSVPTPNGSSWNWNTFHLKGSDGEWNMRALVKDLSLDNCPDIIVGSKSGDPRIPGQPTGDVRWWQCNKQDNDKWQPKLWKAGLSDIWLLDKDGDGKLHDDLPDLWGERNIIAGDIYWVMEMKVVNFVKGINPHGTKDYPEILITDRKKLSYMYLKDVRDIDNASGWQNVKIDNPNDADEPFLWSDIGQLVNNAKNGNEDPLEIIAAYDDRDGDERGVFARLYRCTNWTNEKGCGTAWDTHAWEVSEVIVNANLDPNKAVQGLPWDPLANKAAALADVNGDGKNEIIATIRGHNFSGIFSLTPPGGTPPDCFKNCTSAQQWTYQRIGPYYSEALGEIKYDNLALIDVDLDCDIDLFSVEENLGEDKGLGVVWYENPLPQGSANGVCTIPIQNSMPVISVVPSIALNEGSTTSRAVLVTDADDAVDQVELAVDSGVLTKGAPGNWTWTYTAGNGTSNEQVRITATDARGGSSEKIVNVLVINVPPTITSISGPSQVNEGSTATITVNAADPFDMLHYSYDCDNNGVYEMGPALSNQGLCLFRTDGVKRVNVRVDDGDGGVEFGFVSVTVLNVAPTITSVTVGPTSGAAVEGNTYRVFAEFTDPGMENFSCSINYGDGTDSVLRAPGNLGESWRCIDSFHIYKDNGNYSVTVTIGDGTANTQSVSTIAVANVAPAVTQPVLNPSSDIDMNMPVSAAVTFSDPGTLDAPFTCTIDFGAGAGAVAGAVNGTNCSSQSPHPYNTPGDYTVKFTVTDKDGGIGTSTKTIKVENLPPVVSPPAGSNVPLSEGTTFLVTATFTDGGDNGPYSCTVNYGDGSGNKPGGIESNGMTKTCVGPTHTYQDNGTFQVQVSVADKDGVSGSNSKGFFVSNVAPLVTAAGMTISENGVATVSGTIADPSPLDTFSLLVDWADGTTETFPLPAGTTTYSLSHRYLDDNPTSTPSDTVIVAVQVTDDDGGVGTVGASVTINNIAPVASIDSVKDNFGNFVGQVPPNDVAVLLADLQFSVSGSFSDTGTLDTHTASIDWGDGTSWNGPAAGTVTQTHTYPELGNYVITFSISDDDTGISTVTRSVTVVDAAGAIANVIEVLRNALTDANVDPQVKRFIEQALNELAGQAGGTGQNGALSKLEAKAWTAMLVKTEDAVADLEQAGMDALASQLVMAMKSLLIGLIEGCAARAQSPSELKAVAAARAWIANGDEALTLAGKLQAYKNAFQVLRPALPN